MEEVTELKLEDLVFEDNGGGEAFDAFAQPDAKPGGDDIQKPEEEIKIPGSENKEGQEAGGSESVANEDKGNQGQADEAKDEKGGNSSSPKLNDSEQLYSTLATHLINKGALSDLDPKEIKTVEDLNAAIQKEAENRLDAKQKLIDEALSVGAPAAPIAEISEIIEKLENVTEEKLSDEANDSLRLNLIAQDFVNKGYDAARAATLAQRSIDSGTGVEDAKFALAGIIDHEKNRRQGIIDKAKDDEKESLNQIKDTLADEKNALGGIKLDTAQQQEVFKQMTTGIAGTRETAFIKYQKENPIESRVKLETVFYLTKGLTDFSIFGVNAKTEASKDLETLLRGASFTEDGKIETEVKDPNANFSVKDFKDLEIDLNS